MVEYSPTMCKFLGPISCTTKKERKTNHYTHIATYEKNSKVHWEH